MNAEGERLNWSSGLVTSMPSDDNPHTFTADHGDLLRAACDHVDPADPAITRLSGYVWNTWHAPSLWDIPDSADLSDPEAYPEWFRRGLVIARQANPDISVHIEVFSPFTHLLELFGYQNALMALLDAPETCHRLLERFTREVIAQVHCYAPVAPDAVLISSAFAGAGFLSRAMYRAFVMPYEREVVGVIRDYRIPSCVHTCGAIGDRLDLMAETQVDGIDTLDPPPLGTVDLAKAKSDFGDRFFFKGNLDSVNEMLRADDDAFERAVTQRLQIGKPGGGYILSSACSVAPHVRPERLARMVELAEEFGRY